MQVVLNTNFGPRAVTIQKVGMSVVDVDLNHPMAGKDLHFDIEVVDVREASPEEVEHGHVHGDGRSEEHTSELQSLMRISYAVFCLKKKKTTNKTSADNKVQR